MENVKFVLSFEPIERKVKIHNVVEGVLTYEEIVVTDVYHSSELNWGYMGESPRQLAYELLKYLSNPSNLFPEPVIEPISSRVVFDRFVEQTIARIDGAGMFIINYGLWLKYANPNLIVPPQGFVDMVVSEFKPHETETGKYQLQVISGFVNFHHIRMMHGTFRPNTMEYVILKHIQQRTWKPYLRYLRKHTERAVLKSALKNYQDFANGYEDKKKAKVATTEYGTVKYSVDYFEYLKGIGSVVFNGTDYHLLKKEFPDIYAEVYKTLGYDCCINFPEPLKKSKTSIFNWLWKIIGKIFESD